MRSYSTRPGRHTGQCAVEHLRILSITGRVGEVTFDFGHMRAEVVGYVGREVEGFLEAREKIRHGEEHTADL